jgi:starvation-inducible DNA-binding protein
MTTTTNGTIADPETAVTAGLTRLLADTYTIGLITQGYHWNVTGPSSHSLHLLFDELHDELAAAVDVIAERIRALDAFAPASYRELAAITTIVEHDCLDATEMIRHLLGAQDAVIATAKALLGMADQAHDEPTVDLAIQRIGAHQTAAWTLRSLLA